MLFIRRLASTGTERDERSMPKSRVGVDDDHYFRRRYGLAATSVTTECVSRKKGPPGELRGGGRLQRFLPPNINNA